MLEELEVHDLGPIHSALITPSATMTAITGETGAGKSMLLNAIRLISGGQADGTKVAHDAQSAWAQGVFLINDDLSYDLHNARGIDAEDHELFLTRTVPVQGRSRASVNGRTAPRSLLSELSTQLITIHGQSDQLRIAHSARQREVLDSYAHNQAQREAYAKAWQEYSQLTEKMQRLREQESTLLQQSDYLQRSIELIDEINPVSGELEELKARRTRMEHATQIMQGVSTALARLDGSDDDDAMGALDQITIAIHALHGIGVGESFDDAALRLQSAAEDIRDVVFSLSQEYDDDNFDGDLDSINERIHALDELTKRWGPTLDDVLAWRTQAQFDLEDMDASPEAIAQLQQECDASFTQVQHCAQQLSASRREAARELSHAVDTELTRLSMPGASLQIVVTERSGTHAYDASGGDDISFMFTPFAGAKPMPMAKSASGGELSRLMLALELSLAQAHMDTDDDIPAMTFIFDEVDAGVGGVAGAELGKRLATLAQHAQVIVVTHLPQVASWASKQYVVEKRTQNGSTQTQVRSVEGEERVTEIARMLSGSDSHASLDHARELLATSQL